MSECNQDGVCKVCGVEHYPETITISRKNLQEKIAFGLAISTYVTVTTANANRIADHIMAKIG